MKRTISGRPSLQQPGVLKPRNEEFTPTNRQSSGQAMRKSFVPKFGLGGSAKRAAGRKGRSSTENVLRSSLASSRFTPTRLRTPACAPTSVNRLSTDSARNSGIGTSTRKDTRYVTDPSYKSQCIDKILNFLHSRHQTSYQRRSLLTPSTKDFVNIFNSIYQNLDPSYTLPSRFEEEIPKLLKRIHCPIQLTKSSFVTVGSPHTWPAILAALAFMVDFIHIDSINQESSTMSNDFDNEDESSKKVVVFIDLYKCTSDEEIDSCIEIHSENLKIDYEVTDKDMQELEEEVEAAEHELENLPRTADELKELRQCIVQYSDDLEKLTKYLQDLQIAIQNKTAMENSTKQVIMEINAEKMKIDEEVERLKRLQIQQGLSDTDLIRSKNHSQEIGKEIEYQERIDIEIRNQGWNLEVDVSNAQSSSRSSVFQFEAVVERLGLNEYFSDIDMNSEDMILQYDVIMNKILTQEKTARKNVSQLQEKNREEVQALERAKGTFEEKETEVKILETKVRGTEELTGVTREELKRESQLKVEEIESLHHKIIEAHKANKNPDYQIQQLQDVMNEKKEELENCKKKEEACLYEGVQFQMKVMEAKIQSVERQKNMIMECTSCVNSELDKFFEWFDSQIKD